MQNINPTQDLSFKAKNWADIYKSATMRIKNREVVQSIRNTVEAVKILRTKTPEEVYGLIQKEANGGNADLVGILNSLMSKKMALEVYKDTK